MKRIFNAALISGLFAIAPGCTTTEVYETMITSDPPGAEIVVDDKIVGPAPVVVRWRGRTHDRTFVASHTIRALPMYPNQSSKVEYVEGDSHPYYGLLPAEQIPETIHFDMNLIRLSQQQ